MKKHIYFLLLSVFIFSCSNSKSEKTGDLPVFLSSNDVEKVAQKIQNQLQKKKGSQIYMMFDGEEFYKRLSINSRQNPNVGAKNAAQIAENLFVKNFATFLENTDDSLKIHWVEAKEQKGDYIQLSFVWVNGLDINFIELFITRNKEGKIVICDYLDYMLGELATKSIDRFIANRVKYGNNAYSEMTESLTKLSDINKLLAQQNYQDAYSIYQSIPLPFSKEPNFLNKKLGIASRISLPLYIEVLNEMAESKETCKECKSLYKLYISIFEENKEQRLFYWNELKNNYKNKEKFNKIKVDYFADLDN